MMEDSAKLVSLGMPTQLALEVARQIADGANAPNLVRLGVPTQLAIELAWQIANGADVENLASLGMPTQLAVEVARQIGEGGVTSAIADLFTAGVIGEWYDVADTATLWADENGTVPVVVPAARGMSGGRVKRIDDKSGGGFHRICPTDGAVLKRDEIGLLYLEGDGVSHYPLASAPLYNAAGNSTVVAAIAGTWMGNNCVYSESSGTGFYYGALMSSNSAPNYNVRAFMSSGTLADGSTPAFDGVRRVISYRDVAKTFTPRNDETVGASATWSTMSAPNRSSLLALYNATAAPIFKGRFYALAGFKAALSDTDYNAVHAEMDKRVSKAANPLWPVLARWFSGGISGKKLTLSGDSTTELATNLLADLGWQQAAGQYLEGVTIVNGATGGQSCANFITDPSAKGLEALAANGSHLYSLCWGINYTSTGVTTQAELRANLVTCVNRIKTVNPGADIILWGPNQLLSASPVSPTGSGQAYTDVLYNVYESLRGQWADVPVIQKQDILRRVSETSTATDPYMADALHPGPFGQIMPAGQLIDAIRGA